jgi:hypothetical protein
MSAVVVDFPFDPVTATTFGARSMLSQSAVAQERKNSPMSLSIGTPAAMARTMIRFGSG